MLIVTLPPVHQGQLLQDIINHPAVDAVRYNTGVDSAYSAQETLSRILSLTIRYNKPFYVDFKGKQLRIQEWSTLPYGPIVLNHKIKVIGPARVLFRGDDECNLVEVVDGNKIYVDPLPRFAVGRGQSVNIIGENVTVEGLITKNDKEYLKAIGNLGISKLMLSFVDSWDYVKAFEDLVRRSGGLVIDELVLKIESMAGLQMIRNEESRQQLPKYRLMAARDDLLIQIGISEMIAALIDIARLDPQAICASRLFMGLEQGAMTLADVSDIHLMQQFGYQHFMFSDGISRNHFAQAIEFWQNYQNNFPPL